MQVTILYFAHLRKVVGNISREEIDVPDGATFSVAVDAVMARHPALEPHRPSMLLSRNRRWAPPEAPLAPGDELALMPPVSGG